MRSPSASNLWIWQNSAVSDKPYHHALPTLRHRHALSWITPLNAVNMDECVRAKMLGNTRRCPSRHPFWIWSKLQYARGECRWYAPCAFSASAPSMRFILGEPIKPATNTLRGSRYSSSGLPTCSITPACQYHDLVCHGHGFDLIVGHVNHRCIELLVKLGNFHAHADTQGRIKVGERLVKQKRLWFANNGTTNCNALTLAT